MKTLYILPELFEPPCSLFPLQRRASPLEQTTGFWITRYIEPLSAILLKKPELRQAICRALQAEGAFDPPQTKSAK